MKKIFTLSTVTLILIALIILILDDKRKKIGKILTVDTTYSFLYTKEQKIEIALYSNLEEIELLDTEIYNNFKISDGNNTLTLNLSNITYSHSETFLGEEFKKYIYKFDMPNLTNHYSLNNASLEMELLNGKSYKFKVGDINLNFIDEFEILDFRTLDSKKNNPNDLNISKVIINTSNKLNGISKIYVIETKELEYTYENNNLKISLETNNKYMSYFPIIVEASSKIYVIPNYHYVIDYNLLETASEYINIYAIN